MRCKFIQINIFKGKYLDALVEFLRAEKPDVVTLQEVTGGNKNHWPDKTLDIFAFLKKKTGMDGVLAVAHRSRGDASSYFGNAVLVRGEILNHRIVWLRPYQEYERIDYEKEGPLFPRNLFDVTARIKEKDFHALSTHGAWGREPVDTPEKIRQARIIAEHIRSLGDTAFILGGDFNMQHGSAVVATVDAVAQNIVTAAGVPNTLDLRTHYAVERLGKGFAVDFIYTSRHFTVEHVEAVEVDVSDHLPVRAILTF